MPAQEEKREEYTRGVCLTRNSVCTLSRHVVESLLKFRLNAINVEISQYPGQQVVPFDMIESLLVLGFIPVLHGDAILHPSNAQSGFTIYSGDLIIEDLARHFSSRAGGGCGASFPNRRIFAPKVVVFFLTDVDGVFNAPPSAGSAVLIPEIAVHAASVPQIIKKESLRHDALHVFLKNDGGYDIEASSLSHSSKHQNGIEFTTLEQDVTGGIKSKIDACIRIATSCKEDVFILRVDAELSNFENAVNFALDRAQDRFQGTWIHEC